MTLSIAAILIFAVAPAFVSFDALICHWPIMAIIILFIFITVLALWFCPFEIKIDYNTLSIYFPIRKKEIPLKQIAYAEEVYSSKSLKPIFGQIGYFGWWGKYKYEGHNVFLYASNLEHLVCVTLTNGEKIIFSCSEAPEMAKRINRFIECNGSMPQ